MTSDSPGSGVPAEFASKDGLQLPPDPKDLSTLIELGQVVNNIAQLDNLLEAVLDLAIQHLQAERGVIFLREETNGKLTPTAARSLYPDQIVDAEKIVRSVVERVVQGEDAFISQDLSKDTDYDGESAIHYNILSVLCVPLKQYGQVIGAIYLDHGTQEGAFLERDLLFLRAFGAHSSFAIVSARNQDKVQRENTYLRKIAGNPSKMFEVVSRSSVMSAILDTVEMVASSDASVLIIGESGTGKEVVSRNIHAQSRRAEEKFIVQNCAAIPDTLLEAELFGYKKGSFSGAHEDRAGLFEVADQGTLFLDEIGDLSLSSQAKILRALQEGEVKRIGEREHRKVNVRIICATNKDLDQLIKDGTFREDLFYRIKVIHLRIPPLRERPEDISLLCEYFLHFFLNKLGKPYMGFDPKALAILEAYHWPGNVRQLKNETERLAILFQGSGPIASEDLSEDIQMATILSGGTKGSKLHEALETLQKKLVLEALHMNKWNKTHTADDLGVSRRGLQKMIERFGLDRRRLRA